MTDEPLLFAEEDIVSESQLITVRLYAAPNHLHFWPKFAITGLLAAAFGSLVLSHIWFTRCLSVWFSDGMTAGYNECRSYIAFTLSIIFIVLAAIVFFRKWKPVRTVVMYNSEFEHLMHRY